MRFRYPLAADRGVTGDQIVALGEHPVACLDELAGADAHAVTYRADHLAVARQLEELAILARGHPRITLMVEVQGADQILHRHGADELAIPGIDDDAVLLAVEDPD